MTWGFTPVIRKGITQARVRITYVGAFAGRRDG